MPLSNAEKQARWRKRHSERRRKTAQIVAMLMRQQKTEGSADKRGHLHVFGGDIHEFGLIRVTIDPYFLKLAALLGEVLETDQAIMQLQWALAKCRDERRRAREMERQLRNDWLWAHPGMTGKDYRRLRDTEVEQWLRMQIVESVKTRWRGAPASVVAEQIKIAIDSAPQRPISLTAPASSASTQAPGRPA
jgi:hypothetical protein